jgi:hypothetical protein
MEITFVPKDVLRSDPILTQDFSIKDTGFILELLRNKLYSDKERVVVQEYMCNARDAHREIGKEHIPIQVNCPTDFSPYFEVRDFGPGISPERMANIFCFFGESSKRTSNSETGGFGIGAKSAWSICEQFNVITYVNGIERFYSMSIGDTRGGRCDLLSESETEEPNGTKIIVPIQKDKFEIIKQKIIFTSQFWEVKPETNFVFDYSRNIPSQKPFLEEKNEFTLYSRNCGRYSGYNHFNHTGALVYKAIIVDGIIYNFDPLSPSFANEILKVSSNIILFFKTGEIDISASREKIEFTTKTIEAINEKLIKLEKSFKSSIEERINENSLTKDPLEKYFAICKIQDELGTALPISANFIPKFVRNHHFTRDLTSFASITEVCSLEGLFEEGYEQNLVRKRLKYRDFSEKYHLVFCDLNFKDNITRRLRTVFDNVPANTRVYLLRLKDDYYGNYTSKDLIDYFRGSKKVSILEETEPKPKLPVKRIKKDKTTEPKEKIIKSDFYKINWFTDDLTNLFKKEVLDEGVVKKDKKILIEVDKNFNFIINGKTVTRKEFVTGFNSDKANTRARSCLFEALSNKEVYGVKGRKEGFYYFEDWFKDQNFFVVPFKGSSYQLYDYNSLKRTYENFLGIPELSSLFDEYNKRNFLHSSTRDNNVDLFERKEIIPLCERVDLHSKIDEIFNKYPFLRTLSRMGTIPWKEEETFTKGVEFFAKMWNDNNK